MKGKGEKSMAENKPLLPDTFWKCSNCGNTIQIEKPPQECPACRQQCQFLNVTCYTPDCGFTGIDQRLK
jgi:rubrerythrin